MRVKHLTFSMMEATNYPYSNWNCPSKCFTQGVWPNAGETSHILYDGAYVRGEHLTFFVMEATNYPYINWNCHC